MTADHHSVGVLAYGSLIDDPGEELAAVTTEIVRNVLSPIPVEFGRMSKSRGYAPTLVPHPEGACVRAAIRKLDCSVEEAVDMLWRRETRTADRSRGYPGARPDQLNAVQVEKIVGHEVCETLLYTKIGANVDPLTAEHLAELAIGSVGIAKPGLDAISYLMSAVANGIETRLSRAYELEILRQTEAPDLGTALDRLLLR